MNKRILVLAGPSGSGKNSVMNKLIEQCPKFSRLVTATDRDPREGEQDGVDYYFVSREYFLDQLELGNIPEHQYRPERDMYYGIYAPGLTRQLEDSEYIVSQLQIIGAKYLKENFNAVTVFITPESFEILETRIRDRSDLSEEEVSLRLDLARHEMEVEGSWYDYQIINKQGKLDEAVDELVEILRAEGFDC